MNEENRQQAKAIIADLARAANDANSVANRPAEYDLGDDPVGLETVKEITTLAGNLDATVRGAREYQRLEDILAAKYTRDDERKAGQILGLPLKRFRQLADKLDGIQPGLYIVAADTNIGKTAFLANLFLDLADSNPSVTGLYFSLDDPAAVIIDRMTAILTRESFRQEENESLDDYRRRLRSVTINNLKRDLGNDVRMAAARTEARAWLTGAAVMNHIDIRDAGDTPDAVTLERYIRRKATGGPIFIFIDALYNLDVQEEGDIRQANIARANLLKNLSDVFNCPVFTTAELTKRPANAAPRQELPPGAAPGMESIMESGKYAYNANAVFMLYPYDIDQFKDGDPEIIIDVQKNKLSDFKDKMRTRFYSYAAYFEPIGGPKQARAASEGKPWPE